ncbi:hypothetical protein SBOR_7775 [Sclerotinia borealis F-4128]|uniref:Uncharacterized protein n=1 Tax=Sclerotinia borealis (strain F-4128) TaxID=1432307 RepID=W9C7T4_SCLBF|nr:hypothetical protein SBOR_7775 [Sclerotinia borealis F-4128]
MYSNSTPKERKEFDEWFAGYWNYETDYPPGHSEGVAVPKGRLFAPYPTGPTYYGNNEPLSPTFPRYPQQKDIHVPPTDLPLPAPVTSRSSVVQAIDDCAQQASYHAPVMNPQPTPACSDYSQQASYHIPVMNPQPTSACSDYSQQASYHTPVMNPQPTPTCSDYSQQAFYHPPEVYAQYSPPDKEAPAPHPGFIRIDNHSQEAQYGAQWAYQEELRCVNMCGRVAEEMGDKPTLTTSALVRDSSSLPW